MSSHEYARSIAKTAAAQIADVSGFELAHSNALQATADIMMRFITEVGTYAKEAAELEGRTDVNVLDVIEGLNDFGCTCADLLEYVQREPSDPFAQTVPHFPAQLSAVQPPSFASSGVERPKHIPEHLPAFPDPHTYQRTPLVRKRRNAKDVSAPPSQPEQKAQRQAQKSLISVHERLQQGADDARRNPFLEGMAVPEVARLPIADSPGEGASLRSTFQAVLDAEAEARQQQGRGEGADAGPGAPPRREDSDAQRDDSGSDAMEVDDGGAEQVAASSEPLGWQVTTFDAAAAQSTGDAVFSSGRVGFAMDYASQLRRDALQARHSAAVEDAFQTERGAVAAGASRRRKSAFDAEHMKVHRAKVLLASGPDAVLMEFPDGHIPRPGQ